jgi:GDP-L-fucose synthase
MSNATFYKGKKVLVTGGAGLVGMQLVPMLVEAGALVRVVALDDPSRAPKGVEYVQADLRDINACLKAAEGIDFVFHLAGLKGSPLMVRTKPASYFVPMIQFNTNMMEAARRAGVERYLYTSTNGIYAPAEVLHEDDVWKTMPSENDWYAGWAKRMGELQAQAYKIEYGWDKISIIRPANIYGPYDIFASESAMVIPSLIRRAFSGEDPFVVWGDGSPIRDFIHAKDVARAMLFLIENGINEPVNAGSGVGTSIKQLVEIVTSNMDKKPKIVWDSSKPSGDKKRVLDISRLEKYGFKPSITLEQGVREVMQWYKDNRELAEKKPYVLTQNKA